MTNNTQIPKTGVVFMPAEACWMAENCFPFTDIQAGKIPIFSDTGTQLCGIGAKLPYDS
jgi:hypothetical protein